MFWAVVVLSVVTWQVLVHGPLARLDERLSHSLVDTVPRGLSEAASDLGNMTVALPVLAAAMAYAAWRGRRLAALYAALAMAAVPLLVVPLKEWTARPGPWNPGPTATTPRATRRRRWWRTSAPRSWCPDAWCPSPPCSRR
ncbi:hypothetical protein AB6O49_25695 [Streptomyces sp. SBR177]